MPAYCGPVAAPGDFLWQDDPFQLTGGGKGIIETAAVDYILPYWMARYYGVISSGVIQSAAAPSQGVAPDSYASVYGTGLASQVAVATSEPLPLALGGVTLTVIDSAGTARPAPIDYVSTTQINFVVPNGTVAGPAQFIVANGPATQTFLADVGAVAPALFTMNSAGTGVAAATAVLTQASNPALQSPVPVFQCGTSGCAAVPIQFGADTPIYVTFYGTGIRNRSSLANVSASIHGMSVPVLYAGPTPGFDGLDR